MFYVLQNESTAARRRVPILLTDASTGTTAQTGVATTNIFPYVNINGNAFIGGTGSVGEAGFGQYYYQFEINEVATLGLAGIHITAVGCRDYDAISQIAAFNVYSAAGNGISAYDVWSYYIPLSGQNAEDSLGNAVNFANSADLNALTAANQTVNIAAQVWGDDIGSGAFSPYGAGTAGTILYTLGQGGTALTAGDVWDYASRTITGGIADTVTLVTSPVDISYPSMAGLANTIWSTDISSYTSPSAGFDLANASSGSGISAHDVWDFVITGFGQTGSAALYTTETNFTVGNIESYVQTQTPQDVWTYAGIEGRTITGGIADTVTTLTNRSGFAITGGTITTVSDKTGYSLSSTQAFNLTGNITGNLSGSVGSVSGAVGSVTSPVTFNSAQYSAIASSVWNAGTRTLTSSGAGLTAGDVWSYAARTVTGGTINDATVSSIGLTGLAGIAETVWRFSLSGAIPVFNGDTAGFMQQYPGTQVWGQQLSNLLSAEANLVQAASGGTGISAGDVWSYGLRTITGGIADTVTTLTNRSGFAITGGTITTVSDKTGYSLSGTQAFNLTGNITGNLSGSVGSVSGAVGSVTGSVGSVTSAVSVATASMTGIAGTVWTNATRTITGGIADTVTTLTNRSGFAITGGTITTVSDKTGYSLSASQTFNVTGNITGNVSGSVGSVSGTVGSVTGNVGGNVVGSVASVTNPVTFDSAQYVGIASSVWNAATRTLTSGGSGISAYDVWNFDPTAMTSPQAGAILTDIGTDTNTIITDIGNIPNNVWASDVSGYSTPGEAGFELTQAAAGAGLTAGDVWTYNSRTITGGIANTVTTVTNRSGFAITGGTITTVSDKTGYSLSGTQSFNLTGNITGSVSGSVGSVTGNVGGNVIGSVASVTNPVTFNSGQYAAIASSVWNAGTRTLTSSGSGISAFDVWNFVLSDSNTAEVDLVQAAAGSGLTAGDVWTYTPRTLTSGAGITVNAATNIINGPYFVKSNVDGQDGNLDVIRGMVQDIQLTVTDAFQNPFDVTALGLAVNFYDQAGTLVTSYGTSNLYAPAGLVQFTLDTAVTANEGRYNLILSAAGSGNTIKFGPLQTLVRPF